MKRFWHTATLDRTGDAWSVLLDGKPMRIPGGAPLLIHHEPLAHAIVAEWQAAGTAHGGTLSMEEVPLTRLAGTAQDRIAPDPAPVAHALAAYAESDLLCYRATHPLDLVARQARAWQPWLAWLERTHAARLEPAEGVVHRAQHPAALATIREAYAAHSPLVLAALGIAVPAMGSAVLGLALAGGAIDTAAAYEVSCLDELYQAEKWGEDAEATHRRRTVAADLALAERLLSLVTERDGSASR